MLDDESYARLLTPSRASYSGALPDWFDEVGCSVSTCVNLMGVVHGIRTFIPKIIEQDEEAHVVNTASLAGVTYRPARAGEGWPQDRRFAAVPGLGEHEHHPV